MFIAGCSLNDSRLTSIIFFKSNRWSLLFDVTVYSPISSFAKLKKLAKTWKHKHQNVILASYVCRKSPFRQKFVAIGPDSRTQITKQKQARCAFEVRSRTNNVRSKRSTYLLLDKRLFEKDSFPLPKSSNKQKRAITLRDSILKQSQIDLLDTWNRSRPNHFQKR